MDEIKKGLEAAIQKQYGIKTEVLVTSAPADTGADYATNVAMQLAKLVHKAPMIIAEELKNELLENWEIKIAQPGFMNFISPDGYFYEKVAIIGQNTEYFEKNISWDEYHNKVVVTEFSDPNPFKVLHVGHLYTSVVGDSISRMLECAGAKVVRTNFGGDVGLHVAKTIWALLESSALDSSASVDAMLVHRTCSTAHSASPTSLNNPKAEDSKAKVADSSASVDAMLRNLTIEEIAKAYVTGTKAYEEDEAAKEEITSLNAEIYRINREDDHEGMVAKIYWRGRELSYQYFKDFYRRIGVRFDKFYPESTVAEKGLEEVQTHVGSVYEESNGAIVYRGEKLGLHTRVFINQNGLPTYETKDVGLIFTKWADWHFDESVVVTGNEQKDYMKVVLASVSEYAPKLVECTTHLTHGLVKLKGNVKMSSRKGNFLKAVDVLEMVRQELGGEKADEKIVLAAIKYAFLKYKIGGDIIFDPKESVAATGNSGVYLLYSAVRARKILKNCSPAAVSSGVVASESEVANAKIFIRKLSKKIVQYEDVLKEAIMEKEPNRICTYLFELAQEFSRFYENVKVVGSGREKELGKIVEAYTKVMEHGLKLLGIEVPEEM